MHINASPNLSNRICQEDNQSLIDRPGGTERKKGSPGDPKPLVMSQSPQKVSIQITLYQRLQKRKKDETTTEFAF